MTLSDRLIKKTRKPHLCLMCSRTFPAGSSLRYWVGFNEDRDFCHSYCCLTCTEILKYSPEHSFPEDFVKEMLDKNETPEMLLDTILKIKEQVDNSTQSKNGTTKSTYRYLYWEG